MNLSSLILLSACANVPAAPAPAPTPFADSELFSPLPEPSAADWLANHAEDGQTWEQYRAHPGRLPTATRRTIYLQPVEPPDVEIAVLAELAEAWFGLPTAYMPAVGVDAIGPTERNNPFTGQRQLLTGDLLYWLDDQLPSDAFAIVGVTSVDLYPAPDWNFVFGQATYNLGLGVYSTARYGGDGEGLLLRRTLGVMVHELGHMVGMKHCTCHACNMNGANNLAESDRAPLHLCPECLRKLAYATGVDPLERYEALGAWFTAHGLDAEATWTARRLAELKGP